MGALDRLCELHGSGTRAACTSSSAFSAALLAMLPELLIVLQCACLGTGEGGDGGVTDQQQQVEADPGMSSRDEQGGTVAAAAAAGLVCAPTHLQQLQPTAAPAKPPQTMPGWVAALLSSAVERPDRR